MGRRTEASAHVGAARAVGGDTSVDRYHEALGPVGQDLAVRLLNLSRSPTSSAPAQPRHAFLGPAGTFCQAALTALGQPADGSALALPSVEAIVTAVRVGEATDAVIPLETSTTGLIDSSLDTLLTC